MLTYRQLLVPYALPYFVYVAIATVPVDVLPRQAGYALRIVLVGALLVWGRRWFCSLSGPRSTAGSVAWGAVAGLLGTAAWVALLTPFVVPPQSGAWTMSSFWLRLIAAGAIVPVFEELMMRGFVFRLALHWDLERRKGRGEAFQTVLDGRSPDEVGPGEWSWAAVLVSTAVFAAGHGVAEWPAAVVYGLLMCFLWAWRRDLASCIAAHATTNVSLAFYVLATGNWQYW